jgi:GNAT superfamily N-acetyltransferase
MHEEWHRDGILLSTDPARVDRALVHRWLSEESYWARGIPREVFDRSLDHALPFGLYEGGAQVGFARVVSDYATVAYVGDVFVLEPWRGRGLARWMMECMVGLPRLAGLRRWFLLTRDAHALYRQVGFTALASPDRWMERHQPDPYGGRA